MCCYTPTVGLNLRKRAGTDWELLVAFRGGYANLLCVSIAILDNLQICLSRRGTAKKNVVKDLIGVAPS